MPAPARLSFFVALCLCALALHVPAAQAAAPAFQGPATLTSDTGHLLLNWQSDEPVTVDMADSADFSSARVLYRGSAHSFFMSGLGDGSYFLRLRTDSGAVSEPLALSVKHQSLTRALWLVLMGSIITIAIVATILRGARDA